MTQVLELTELAKAHGVTEVDVGSRGVEPLLDPERAPFTAARMKSLEKCSLGQNLFGAA